MELKRKPRSEFVDLYQMGTFQRVVATRDAETKCWRLFGMTHNNVGVFVEKARGGVREWSGLNYVAEFCAKIGISRWEVHMPGVKVTKTSI